MHLRITRICKANTSKKGNELSSMVLFKPNFAVLHFYREVHLKKATIQAVLQVAGGARKRWLVWCACVTILFKDTPLMKKVTVCVAKTTVLPRSGGVPFGTFLPDRRWNRATITQIVLSFHFLKLKHTSRMACVI